MTSETTHKRFVYVKFRSCSIGKSAFSCLQNTFSKKMFKTVLKTVGKNKKKRIEFWVFPTGFVGKSSDITKKYFLNQILTAALLYCMKTLQDKVNNDVFVKHWAVPYLLLCQDPYEHYLYLNSVEAFLKDHCSFSFLVMCLHISWQGR